MSAHHNTSDPERDAWLSQALRHAPDADVAAPAAVSAAILQQARAVVAPPARSAWSVQLMAAWSWLARPPVAAGFASLMVATVVGLMGWGRPLEEALPPREEPVSAAPAAPAMSAAAPVPAAPTPAPEPVPARANASRKQTSASEAPKAAAAPTLPPDRREQASADAAPPREAEVAARPSAAQGNAAQRQGASESAELTRKMADAAADIPSTRLTAPDGERTARADALVARSRLAGVAPAPMALTSSSAGASLPGLIAALRAEPQRWSWQRGALADQALTPALLQWLAQLEAAVGARWQPLSARAPGSAMSAAPVAGTGATSETASTELRLWRDGRPHSVLRLGELDAQLDRIDAASGANTGSQRAELNPEAIAALRASLDQATR